MNTDLLDAALAFIRAGVSIIPIDHTTKRPAMRLLPKAEYGRPVWKPYEQAIADEATVRRWFAAGIEAFAMVGGKVSGGLLVIDFDVPRFYGAWRAAVGELADGLPIQQTGGGGYQVLVRCSNPGGNDKLAWAPDEQEQTGRTIAIETRGEGGYAVVAPSLHPSGKRYAALPGPALANIPAVEQTRADALVNAARKLDEAPCTRQEQERVEAEARQGHQRQQAGMNGHASVIDAFNAAHPLEALLEAHGYTKGSSGRYIRPGGKSESVSVKDGRSCHWSSNDPLNDGRGKGGCGCHDAFDLFSYFEHGGDVRNAVKAAAELLGMRSPKAQATGKAKPESAKQRPAQADILVALADEADLFHTPGGNDAYATVAVGDVLDTARINGRLFRGWLAGRFYRETGKTPCAQALQDALGVLAGRAIYEGPEIPVAVRVAEHEGTIWLDLADRARRAVQVSATGWRVVDSASCPVRFTRPGGVLALPVPVAGGSLLPLRALANLRDGTSWPLALAWLTAALRPQGPYPVLTLGGEQGCAKSTASRMLRGLVDPNRAPIRAEPREARDLMIAARNGWVIGLDNLSHICPWLSDALCRLLTGGGFSARQLYEDAEECIFDSQRPVILNGIEELATRPDLADRAIALTLPSIAETERRPEAELWPQYEAERPAMLGALLDAVSAGLRNLPTTRLSPLPRMADFAIWAKAAEPALPVTGGAVLSAYAGNRAASADVALESAATGPALLALMESEVAWIGTAAELLAELEQHHADDRTKRRPDWPKTPQAMGGALRRLAPVLRQRGLDVTPLPRAGHKRPRTIRIERRAATAATLAPTAPTPEDAGEMGGPCVADVADALQAAGRDRPPEEPTKTGPAVHVADVADAPAVNSDLPQGDAPLPGDQGARSEGETSRKSSEGPKRASERGNAADPAHRRQP